MLQWILNKRPKHQVKESHFKLVECDRPEVSKNEFLVRTLYLGVAPVMLRYMKNETSFEKPLNIGDVMIGRGVGEVIESRDPDIKVGEIIHGKLGWREYSILKNEPYYMIHQMKKTELSPSLGLSTLGLSGFTALIGAQTISNIQPGDNVLVSGAAGGVGSQVAFIAKALGAKKVVGIAGGSEKCSIIKNDLSYDQAIDYKNDLVPEKLDDFFKDGIDVYFDNVGGEILDHVLERINRRARIAICGRMSEYLKNPKDYHHYKNIYRIGLTDSKMEGFFVYDFVKEYHKYEDQLVGMIRDGKIIPREDILEGFEKMPEALISLYEHRNIGVRMVKVS